MSRRGRGRQGEVEGVKERESVKESERASRRGRGCQGWERVSRRGRGCQGEGYGVKERERTIGSKRGRGRQGG